MQLRSIRSNFIKDITSPCLTRSDAVLGQSKPVLGQFHSKPLWWKLIKCPAITRMSISPTPVPHRSVLYQRTRGLGNTICCQVRGHTCLWREAKWIYGKSAETENNTNTKGSNFKRCNIGLEWGGQNGRCNMRYCLFSLLLPPPSSPCQCVTDSLWSCLSPSLKGLKPLLLVEVRRKGECMC